MNGRNVAEREIGKFKYYFIAGIHSTDTDPDHEKLGPYLRKNRDHTKIIPTLKTEPQALSI